MVRLDSVAMQGGKGASLMMPPVCVCGAGSNVPTRPAQSSAEPTCPQCGGSLPKPEEAQRPERPGRRQLQDFLSAFV